MDYDKLESRIADEYNIVHAWIAVHPYAAVFAAVVLGALLGHFL